MRKVAFVSTKMMFKKVEDQWKYATVCQELYSAEINWEKEEKHTPMHSLCSTIFTLAVTRFQ